MSEHIFSVIMNAVSSSFSPFIRKLYLGSLYTVSVHHIIRVEAGRTLDSPRVVTRPEDGDDYDDADDARAAVLGCMQMSSSPIVNRSLTRNSEYSYGRGCVSQNYRNYHRRE